MKDKSELERYRAVREERQKWEEREQRWTKQLAKIEQQLQLTERRSGSSGTSNPPPSSGISSCEFSINDCTSGVATPTVSSVSVSTKAATNAPIFIQSSTMRKPFVLGNCSSTNRCSSCITHRNRYTTSPWIPVPANGRHGLPGPTPGPKVQQYRYPGPATGGGDRFVSGGTRNNCSSSTSHQASPSTCETCLSVCPG